MSQVEQLKKEIQQLSDELQRQKRENEELRVTLSQQKDSAAMEDTAASGGFWANISHEILAPMDGILGMTDLVLETKLSSEQRDYLEMVSSSADRLLEVVNDILDYTRLEAGKMEFDFSEFNLLEELECDLFLARVEARYKNIDLDYTFDPYLPAMVESDADRLRQVLSNLVSNGIKFTSEGGVRVDVLKQGYDEDNNLIVRFTVTDTGIGVATTDQKSIFQFPGSTIRPLKESGKLSGVGLGLVVSAKIIEKIGGEVGVESSPGKGSTFWFTWIFKDISENHGLAFSGVQRDQKEINFVLQGARVLLAEDEKISATVTKAYLEQIGVKVTVVANGSSALEEAKKGGYHIVLMDVEMPVLDGLEATQAIRQFEGKRGKHLPIVALTAHALHGDKEKCLQAGMDEYLTKPLNKSQLLTILTKYMMRRVLVVGLEQKSQQLLVKALVESGWSVTIAETGRFAKYEASLSNFDLIVIDTLMVNNEAVEIASTIRGLEEFTGSKAIILGVGEIEKIDRSHFTQSGFDSFTPLPASGSQLKKRFSELKGEVGGV